MNRSLKDPAATEGLDEATSETARERREPAALTRRHIAKPSVARSTGEVPRDGAGNEQVGD